MARLITLEETLKRVSCSKTYLYKLISKGEFPKQVPVGVYKIAFVESEVDDWIKQKLQARANDRTAYIRKARAVNSVYSASHCKNKVAEE